MPLHHGAGSDYGVEKLTRLIVPHIEQLVKDDRIIFPIGCEEGTNYCWKDGRNGRIWANDDFIFLLEFAGSLARSDKMADRILGVAIVTRGLTDDDPATHRQGWPLDATTVTIAARHLGMLPVTAAFIKAVLDKAPRVSDAMLNR